MVNKMNMFGILSVSLTHVLHSYVSKRCCPNRASTRGCKATVDDNLMMINLYAAYCHLGWGL